MSEESAIRIERIKKILEIEHGTELAQLCGCAQNQVSGWRTKGFTKPIERLLDALLDRYDRDKRARKGPPPKLSLGQRIQRARKDQGLSQRALAERMYGGEGLSDNALRSRGSRLEKLEEIDAETLEMVATALGIPKEELSGCA